MDTPRQQLHRTAKVPVAVTGGQNPRGMNDTIVMFHWIFVELLHWPLGDCQLKYIFEIYKNIYKN